MKPGTAAAAARDVLADYDDNPVTRTIASMLLTLRDEPIAAPLPVADMPYIPDLPPREYSAFSAPNAAGKRSRRAWSLTPRVRRARAIALVQARPPMQPPSDPAHCTSSATTATVVAHYGPRVPDAPLVVQAPEPLTADTLRIATVVVPTAADPAPVTMTSTGAAGGSPQPPQAVAADESGDYPTAVISDVITLPAPSVPTPSASSPVVMKPTAVAVEEAAVGRKPPRELRGLFGAWNLTGPSGSIADGVRNAMGEDSTLDPRMLAPHTRVKRRRENDASALEDDSAASGSDVAGNGNLRKRIRDDAVLPLVA